MSILVWRKGMQKLKNAVIQKCIEKKISSKELDFLLYISRFQDEEGNICGVYYKDVCASIGISIQSFYNIKDSLLKKGVISCIKKDQSDIDIKIEDNEFLSEENYSEGYINTGKKFLYSGTFRSMKGMEKLLVLELMRLTYCNKGKFVILAENFYKKYMEIFQVSRKTIRGYIQKIKGFFQIKRYEFKLFFLPKSMIKENDSFTDNEMYSRNIATMICRRNRIKQMDQKEAKDISGLMIQYKGSAAKIGKDIKDLLSNAVKKSVEVLNYYKLPGEKIVRELNPALIHKLLKEGIDA